MSGRPVVEAAEAVLAGRLVVFPTDTVYGLGARPDDERAVARIFEAKGRDRSHALPVLVATIDVARAVASLDQRSDPLARAIWPGALTLVLPRTGVSRTWALGGDGSTVAIRVPAHPLALELLAKTGPVAVTSANRSGEPPCTTCHGLRATFGDLVETYLCDEAPLEGAASTVVDLAHGAPTVLRRGGLTAGEIERFLPPGEPLLDSPPSP